MPINFYYEIQHVTYKLKKVEGYLACEKVIINNIKKHLDMECSDLILEAYLKELSNHIEHLTESTKNIDNCINYKFASGFINTLLKMPLWKSWLNEIGI